MLYHTEVSLNIEIWEACVAFFVLGALWFPPEGPPSFLALRLQAFVSPSSVLYLHDRHGLLMLAVIISNMVYFVHFTAYTQDFK